jgi:hypothetical protein
MIGSNRRVTRPAPSGAMELPAKSRDEQQAVRGRSQFREVFVYGRNGGIWFLQG